MTDISLNYHLSAWLRGVQQAWGHESPGESLAIILDSMIHGWLVTLPEVSNLSDETALKVRLKPRHSQYFTQISQFSGFSVADTVRSYLIKWLCSPTQTRSLTNLQPFECPAPNRKSPKPRNKPPKNATIEPKPPHIEVLAPLPAQPQVKAQTPLPPALPKQNGRTLLGGLLK